MNPIFRERAALAMHILKRLWRRRTKRKQATSTNPLRSSKPLEAYGILSIAVDPRYQGLGIGKRLMECCETIAREKGFSEMELTVNPQNEKAIRFYERLGWEKVVSGSGWTGLMRKRLE